MLCSIFCFFPLNFYKFVFQLNLFLVLKRSWDFAFNSEDQLETSRKFNIRFFLRTSWKSTQNKQKNIVQMFDLGRWTRPRLSLLKVAKSEKAFSKSIWIKWTKLVFVSIFVYVNDTICRILISFIFVMSRNTFWDLATFSFYRAWIDYSFLNIYTFSYINIYFIWKKYIFWHLVISLGVTGHLLWCVFQGFWGMNWMKLNVYFSTYIVWSIWWYFCHVAHYDQNWQILSKNMLSFSCLLWD